MSVFETPDLKKLEDYPIWKETSEIVEYMYGQLGEFPDDEKWNTKIKLQNTSNELLFTMAQALGDSAPANKEYIWSQVRKSATALKAMYRFACRQKFLSIEPEMMVRLDKLLKQIDAEVEKAYKRTKAANLEEIEFWQKKYHMWQEMTHEK
ncbi:MAG: hypothetical protein WA843_02805 [Candidatus Saccharimonadales bacterium]